MRITRFNPDLPRGRAVPRKTLQERYARQAAIDRAHARYLHLECGHYSTLDIDEGYSIWRPRKGVSFCEHDGCHKWVEILKPKPPEAISDTPLF
jgi:hypothetical protein